ncbi:MAG: autotransporter-associated beta strand repeat-containing protein, partial [Thermoguttaceae bacterium]|nr:autotransporter-associated beta strand repeat-containing protein [Thermoguttaceae bacterium]
GSTNIHFNGGTIQITESFGEAVNRKIELQQNGGTFDLAEGVSLVLGGNIHGDGGLTKAGAGTLELTCANEYTGGTTVSGGYLKLTNDAVRDNGPVTVASGATLEYAVDGTPATPLTFDTNKKFASAGTVLKTGAGTLKIDAAQNSFDATTLTVKEGRLDMKEYFTGQLAVSNGAAFSPGNSIGTLNLDGDLTLGEAGSGDYAQLIMEIGGSSTDKNDALEISGDLNLTNGKIYLTLADACDLNPGDSFTMTLSANNSAQLKQNDFINTYVHSSVFTDLTYEPLSGGTFVITGTLDANAVPEPATWVLLLLGTFGLMYWRKK